MEYVRKPRVDAAAAPEPEPALGPTAFALLAQFARQPSSAYTVAQGMRRNLHYLWPRAESRIYAEVVRLQQRGLLRGEVQSTGRRARTVMHVTPAGRAQLKAFLAGPVIGGLVLESESLLRVYFATLGERDDLRRALEQLRVDAVQLQALAIAVGEGYLRGEGIAQEQGHVRAMIHALLSRLSLLVRDWAEECLEEVQGWADLAPEGKKKAAARRFSGTQQLLLEAGRAPGSPGAAPRRRVAAGRTDRLEPTGRAEPTGHGGRAGGGGRTGPTVRGGRTGRTGRDRG